MLAPFETLTSLEILGLALITIGMVGIYFSPYKYLLTYLTAGMCYWLVIEGLSFLLSSGFGLGVINAYIGAVGLSVMGVFAWIVATEPERARRRALEREANYIEHTPLLEGDVPTSTSS